MLNRKVASAATVVVAALSGMGRYGHAAVVVPQVPIPNFSFETPDEGDVPPYGQSDIDDWKKEGAFGNNAAGTFYNTAAVPPQVDNADGHQMAFIFAGGGTGLYQILDGTNPNHTTAQLFTVGSSYGASAYAQGGGGMDASALEIRMFYNNGTNGRVTVGTPGIFINHNPNTSPISHLLPLFTPSIVVQPGDPFADQPIGIELVSIPQDGVIDSGYFDVDTVVIPEPTSAGVFAVVAGVMGFRRVRRQVGERQA